MSSLRILYICTLDSEFKEEHIIPFTKISQKEDNYIGYIYAIHMWRKTNVHERLVEFKRIQENTFICGDDLNAISTIHSQMSKLRRAFVKVAKLWKLKRAKIYNTDDLFMTPIVDGQKNTITILKNNMRYIFSLRELIGHFNRELTNVCNLFVEPLPCKNPYTNECFSKSDLYNIYFAIRASSFVMPALFHSYFLSNFCLSEFTNLNEHEIREHYIEKYVNHITNDILLACINDMLVEHHIDIIKINKNFPKQMLKELMEPYLKLYYISKLTKNRWKRAASFMKLHMMLHELQKESPGFGRKKYLPNANLPEMFTEQNKRKREPQYMNFYFETKMPKIKQITLEEFMENHSHLNVKYDSRTMYHYDMLQSQAREHIISRSMPPRYEEREMHEESSYSEDEQYDSDDEPEPTTEPTTEQQLAEEYVNETYYLEIEYDDVD